MLYHVTHYLEKQCSFDLHLDFQEKKKLQCETAL